MTIQTFTLTVFAARDAVFNFLADIENLPKWATGYCERIALQRGRWWALTADGEQVVDIQADAAAGVIDLRAGFSADRMTLTPIRVVGLDAHRTLVSFILMERPDQKAGNFARRSQIMSEAIDGLRVRFGGGELHLPEAALPWLQPGVN